MSQSTEATSPERGGDVEAGEISGETAGCKRPETVDEYLEAVVVEDDPYAGEPTLERFRYKEPKTAVLSESVVQLASCRLPDDDVLVRDAALARLMKLLIEERSSVVTVSS